MRKLLLFGFAIWGIIGCKQQVADATKLESVSEGAALEVIVLVNDTNVFDTLSLLAHYYNAIMGKRITDTIYFDANGRCVFRPNGLVLPQQFVVQMPKKWSGAVYIKNGVKLQVDLRDAAIDWKGDRFFDVVTISEQDAEMNVFANKYWSDTTRYNFSSLLNGMKSAKTDEELMLLFDSTMQLMSIQIDKYGKQYGQLAKDYLSTSIQASIYPSVCINFWRRGVEPSAKVMQNLIEFTPALKSGGVYNYYRTFCYMHRSISKNDQTQYLNNLLSKEGLANGAIESHFQRLYAKRQIDNLEHDEALTEVFYHLKKVYRDEMVDYETALLLDRTASFLPSQQDAFLAANASSDLLQRYAYFKAHESKFKTKEYQIRANDIINQLAPKAEALAKKLEQPEFELTETILGTKVAQFDFGANLYVNEGASVDDLFGNLREEFKEKRLLIDVWGTWCGPCKRDMKASSLVKKELKQKGVEVVYISTEGLGALQKWKEVILEMEGDGTHILLNSKLSKELVERFSIRSYPTVLLLNLDESISQDLGYNISQINVDDFTAKYLER